ncbi:MAG: hypothetical protein V2J55_06890 [Candidatus Competibacteraceae bacterium]|jgi:hypothetical protein|nr:hypothetical protein [Candidatus Competibacteraceae bacterium]
MPTSVTINVNSKQALQQLENFTNQVDAKHQVRGEVLARDNNGNITKIRLYTRKNGVSNAYTTEGRGKKYQAARDGINAILNQQIQNPETNTFSKHLNMLGSNSNKLLGSRLKAAISKDQVLVNNNTTATNLHALSSRQRTNHQMRGIDNKDGTYILYSKSTTRQFGRSGKYTAFDQGVNKVFSNMKNQDPKLGGLMESLYSQKAVKVDGSNALKSRQFNSGIREVKTESYKQATNELGIKLAGKLPEIQDHLLNQLNTKQLNGDPMRENLGMDKVYAAMKKIEAGNMSECTPAELIKAVQFISKANPAMPMGALTQLANSDHALNAAGPYTGKNTPSQTPVPFNSQQVQPDNMRQAAINLHQAVNEQLTPKEKAALRERVEFTAKLANMYDEKMGPCGSGNQPGDNAALWAKSFNVNIGNQTGYDPAELVSEVGGKLLEDLSAAKGGPIEKQKLQALIPQLQKFAAHKPEQDKLNGMINKLSQELQKPQLNENEIKKVLGQLEGAVRRDAAVVPRDLMTALVLNKDIIFPTGDRLNEIGNQIANLDQQVQDLQEDQDKAKTPKQHNQLQRQINGLQTQKDALVKHETAVKTALLNEVSYQSKDWDQKEVFDLLMEKDELERNITDARQEHRWDDAIRDLAKLDKLVAKHQDTLDKAGDYDLPTTSLDPQIRQRILLEQQNRVITNSLEHGGLV